MELNIINHKVAVKAIKSERKKSFQAKVFLALTLYTEKNNKIQYNNAYLFMCCVDMNGPAVLLRTSAEVSLNETTNEPLDPNIG